MAHFPRSASVTFRGMADSLCLASSTRRQIGFRSKGMRWHLVRRDLPPAIGLAQRPSRPDTAVMKLVPPLPIDAVLGEVRAALAARSAAVLVAPPGAGKTTRVPLALLEEGW